jgi:hypothetical protein
MENPSTEISYVEGYCNKQVTSYFMLASAFGSRPRRMLRVIQRFRKIAVAVFRVSDFWRSFDSCYLVLALGNVSEVKPWWDERWAGCSPAESDLVVSDMFWNLVDMWGPVWRMYTLPREQGSCKIQTTELGIFCPWWKNKLHSVHTDSGAHPASYPMGTGESFRGR